MVKNKKAWMRILEAVIAVAIVISGIVIIVSNNTHTSQSSEVIYEKEAYILEIINKNESLRNFVLAENYNEIDSAIEKMIPKSWNFATKICKIEDICNTDTPNDRDVYSSEVVISSDINEYNPKKLRIFVWL